MVLVFANGSMQVDVVTDCVVNAALLETFTAPERYSLLQAAVLGRTLQTHFVSYL